MTSKILHYSQKSNKIHDGVHRERKKISGQVNKG